MDPQTRTILVMVVAAIFLVVWDIYVAFFNKVPNSVDTISGISRKIGKGFVGFPFMWGVLAGHFWGPSHNLFEAWSPLYLIAIVIAFSGMHFILRRFIRIPAWSLLVYLLLGIGCGSLFWTQ